MRLYGIQVDIYESRHAFPIVQHRFLGLTPEEAESYHQAHREADTFLRQCEDQQLFAGDISCRTVITRGWAQGRGREE